LNEGYGIWFRDLFPGISLLKGNQLKAKSAQFTTINFTETLGKRTAVLLLAHCLKTYFCKSAIDV
jgi:hypothetical protein